MRTIWNTGDRAARLGGFPPPRAALFAALVLAIAPVLLALDLCPGLCPPCEAQMLGLNPPSSAASPLSDPTMTPGKALLFDLEARFAKATAEGGGKAFAAWFADDAVTLGNGEATVEGHDAIAKQANWSPDAYQLTWTPTDARMAPSGDMGFTWGHYEGRSHDANGNLVVTSGRYMTVWRKQPDGIWKVVLDSSNNEPPGAGDCCKLPPIG